MVQKIQPKRFSKNLNLQLVVAVLLFAVAAVLSRDNAMSSLEKTVFNFFYGLPDFLTPFFLLFTQFGNIYVLLLLAAIYLIKQHYHIVLRLLMSGLLAYLLAGVAKDLVGRVRPDGLINGVIFRDYYVRGPGFPSGHTALATAMALTLNMYLPKKYQWLMPTMIVGVGMSRIYLGVHLPLDVVGGFALGWFSFLLFRHVRVSDITRRSTLKTKKVLKKRKNDSKLK